MLGITPELGLTDSVNENEWVNDFDFSQEDLIWDALMQPELAVSMDIENEHPEKEWQTPRLPTVRQSSTMNIAIATPASEPSQTPSLAVSGPLSFNIQLPGHIAGNYIPNEYETDVEKYFEEAYMVLPVLDRRKLWQQILNNGTPVGTPFQTLLEAIRLIVLSCSFRKEPNPNTRISIHDQIECVESYRSKYDFADCADLDAVAVSLFLFCAYNITLQNNRAFIYLGEACDLFNLVSHGLKQQKDMERSLRSRLARMELVLANTVAASYSIYGAGLPNIRQRRSLNESVALLRRDNHRDLLERTADDLVIRLAEIHAASQPEAADCSLFNTSGSIQDSSDSNGRPLSDLESFAEPQISLASRMQTADVIISSHWRALEKLAIQLEVSTNSVLALGRADVRRYLAQTLCERCSATLACAAALGEGSLRIVGLGKLVKIVLHANEIAVNRYVACASIPYKNVLAGLVFTVMRADYERAFATSLGGCVDVVTGLNNPNTSLPLLSAYCRNYDRGNQESLGDGDIICDDPHIPFRYVLKNCSIVYSGHFLITREVRG